VGHDYKWPSSPCTTCSRAGYLSWMLGALVGGHDYRWPSSPFTAVSAAQTGRWRAVSWGSRLQMALKCSYHLQPCQLRNLDNGGGSVGVRASKSSYHLQLFKLPKFDTRGPSVGGHDYKMASKSFCHLQPCRLPKLDTGGASVGGHDYKWPSSPPTIYSHAGYPSWTPEGCQLGVTSTNGFQVLLPSATMPATQVRR